VFTTNVSPFFPPPNGTTKASTVIMLVSNDNRAIVMFPFFSPLIFKEGFPTKDRNHHTPQPGYVRDFLPEDPFPLPQSAHEGIFSILCPLFYPREESSFEPFLLVRTFSPPLLSFLVHTDPPPANSTGSTFGPTRPLLLFMRLDLCRECPFPREI